MPVLNPTYFPGPFLATVPPQQLVRSTAQPEKNIPLPFNLTPQASWLDYKCWLSCDLDPGTVLHKTLPQQAWNVDSLASVDCQSPNLDTFNGIGVNINSGSPTQDVIQQMATSTYRFVLRGYGCRAAFQVPVPGLVKVGNLTPVPTDPQRTSGNILIGNFSGVPIFYCMWELHYIVSGAPSGSQVQLPIPYDPHLHIRPDTQVPTTIPLPFSVTDNDHSGPIDNSISY